MTRRELRAAYNHAFYRYSLTRSEKWHRRMCILNLELMKLSTGRGR